MGPRGGHRHLATAAAILAAAGGAAAQGGDFWLPGPKLGSEQPWSGNEFGWGVSIDGDTAVVGEPRDESSRLQNVGAAEVFVRSGLDWVREARLEPSAVNSEMFFGVAAAVRADTALVGAPFADHSGLHRAGAVFVFERAGTTWTERAVLTAGDAEAGDHFGSAVALSGDTAVIGAPTETHGLPATGAEGAAYVFVRTGSVWSEQAKLVAGDPDSFGRFGEAVAVWSDTALIGAPAQDVDGAAYAFVRAGTSWSEQRKFQSKVGSIDPNEFGDAVALDADTAVIGAPYFDGGAVQSGRAFVFVRSGTTWSKQGNLEPQVAVASAHYGASVAVSGDLAVVGAYRETVNSQSLAGAVHVHRRHGSSWSVLEQITAPVPASDAYFGLSVAATGEVLIAGAPGDVPEGSQPPGSATFVGSAFVFHAPSLLGTCGSCSSYCTAGTSASGCAALLTAYGQPSATAPDGFVLTASEVEGSKQGIYFFGTSGPQANPWGNGSSFQCVAPPVMRAGTQTGVGQKGDCSGLFAQDLNALWSAQPTHQPGAGATVQAQLWYRDPLNTSNQTTSLSNAIELTVGP